MTDDPKVTFRINGVLCPEPKDRDALGDLAPTFVDFVDRLRARLAQGRRDYGDESLDRAPAELLAEIEQELLDVAGWSVVLLHRIARLRRAAKGARR